MSTGRAEALEVLRDVWRREGQAGPDIDASPGSHCKKMVDAGVGYDDYAGGDETDRTAAWRARLAREGKLNPAGSLRDLVLGPAQPDADAQPEPAQTEPAQPEPGQPEPGQPQLSQH